MGAILENDLLMGPLRAIVPAIVAYCITKFNLPAWLPVSELDGFLVAAIAAWWSYQSNKKTAAAAPAKPDPI